MSKQYIGTFFHCLSTLILTYIDLTFGLCSVVFFISREIAQSEYRYIESHGNKRYDCPWYCGLLIESWTVKGFLDWALPLILYLIYYYIIIYY